MRNWPTRQVEYPAVTTIIQVFRIIENWPDDLKPTAKCDQSLAHISETWVDDGDRRTSL